MLEPPCPVRCPVLAVGTVYVKLDVGWLAVAELLPVVLAVNEFDGLCCEDELGIDAPGVEAL